MDVLTFVVLAGWVLMYIIPSFFMAAFVALALAAGASFLVAIQNGLGSDIGLALITTGPVALGAIFTAWPVACGARWIARRLKGAGA
ncbi:MAG: hypothetical protein AAF871_02365 [Pseudomonadota bacterium]